MTSHGRLGTITVNRMGFGAMQLAGPGVLGPPKDPDAARAVLRRAIELGVDHLDTAQFYGPDVVNALIRETLHPYPDGLRIATKVGARRDAEGAWLPAQDPQHLREDVEANLRALGVERMDLVNLRRHGDGPGVPIAEQLGVLQDLRDEGKLDQIGVSTVTRDELDQALDLVDVACVQNPFSIIDRSDEDVLERCIERDVAYVPYFPLGSAFTGGPAKLAADPAIAATAEKHGATTTQIALAWLLARDEHVLLIAGTSSVAHLEENLAAGDLELDAEDLGRLAGVVPAANPLG
ncbi:aldo/keto reductase [Patulibacter sp. NPDC049589]|uniref:aldo/keto reductase n=1 Tax=Patulibacter sp. NPDC049589 TaxID=3154731 RepID=UPI0034358D93